MPSLRKLCAHPTCGEPAAARSTRCDDHAYNRDYQQEELRRPTASERGYTSGWRRIRRVYLENNPLCEIDGCGSPATEVDHIKPLAEGGSHRFSNLQAACKSCHSRKTIAENRGDAGRVAARY